MPSRAINILVLFFSRYIDLLIYNSIIKTVGFTVQYKFHEKLSMMKQLKNFGVNPKFLLFEMLL